MVRITVGDITLLTVKITPYHLGQESIGNCIIFLKDLAQLLLYRFVFSYCKIISGLFRVWSLEISAQIHVLGKFVQEIPTQGSIPFMVRLVRKTMAKFILYKESILAVLRVMTSQTVSMKMQTMSRYFVFEGIFSGTFVPRSCSYIYPMCFLN